MKCVNADTFPEKFSFCLFSLTSRKQKEFGKGAFVYSCYSVRVSLRQGCSTTLNVTVAYTDKHAETHNK